MDTRSTQSFLDDNSSELTGRNSDKDNVSEDEQLLKTGYQKCKGNTHREKEPELNTL